MDKKVIPLVEFFNQRGLKTHMSCEGHNKTNMSIFRIQFDKSVTEDDLIHLEVLVASDDLGRVIGKNGKTVNSIRNVVQASSTLNEGKRIKIEVDSY